MFNSYKRQVASTPKAERPVKIVPKSDVVSGSSGGERRFWVVSPNVTDNPSTIDSWKEAIKRHSVAFMGWGPDDPDHKLGPGLQKVLCQATSFWLLAASMVRTSSVSEWRPANTSSVSGALLRQTGNG